MVWSMIVCSNLGWFIIHIRYTPNCGEPQCLWFGVILGSLLFASLLFAFIVHLYFVTLIQKGNPCMLKNQFDFEMSQHQTLLMQNNCHCTALHLGG